MVAVVLLSRQGHVRQQGTKAFSPMCLGLKDTNSVGCTGHQPALSKVTDSSCGPQSVVDGSTLDGSNDKWMVVADGSIEEYRTCA